jgi:hypothetical protein
MPSQTSVTVISDSQSAVQGVLAYTTEHRQRARMRAAGAPCLELIDDVWQAKVQRGARVALEWCRAHTDGNNAHTVGNRIADFAAKKALEMKIPPPEHDMLSSAPYYNLLCKGKVACQDPRRMAKVLLEQRPIKEWRDSKSQWLLSGHWKGCRCLWQWAADNHRLGHTRWLLRAMSDTMRWTFKEQKARERCERRCRCSHAAALSHLLACEEWSAERLVIFRTIASVVYAGHWSMKMDKYCKDCLNHQWSPERILEGMGVWCAGSTTASFLGAFIDKDVMAIWYGRFGIAKERAGALISTIRKCLLDRVAALWKLCIRGNRLMI